MKKTLSAELVALRANALAALHALDDRHLSWMVDALRHHFRRRVEELELDIARHHVCADEAIVPYAFDRHRPRSRHDEIERARASLAQYRLIQVFVEELSALVSRANAEDAGRVLAASLVRRGRGARP